MPVPQGYMLDQPTAPKLPKGYVLDQPQSQPAQQVQPQPTASVRATPSWGQQLSDLIHHPLNALESASQPISRPSNASIPEMVSADVANVGAGAAGVIRHPINTIGGALKTAASTVLDPLGTFKKTYDQANTNGPQFGATTLGQGLAMGAAGKALPLAAKPLETIGEKAQGAGEGIINRNVMQVRKADVKRGANPGQGYFQAGFGPSMSMQSIAGKSANALEDTGEAIGNALDNGTGSGVVIPGEQVAATVAKPASAAREVLNGPFGPGSADLDARMARFQGSIQPQMTPRDVFGLKKNVADNVSWSDPTAIGTKQVGQQITGGLSGLISDYVPELKPLNSQYQNLTSLSNLARDRATTGQRSLTGMATKAGLGLAGAGLGLTHSPLMSAAGAALGLGLDSVPFKTTLASGLYYGGRGAVAMGRGISGLYAPKTPDVPATFAFDRKPPQLESSYPTNNSFGEDYSQGPIQSRNPIIPPAPRTPLTLPASTNAGEAQPMIGVKASTYPPLAEDFARNRTVPTQFAKPPQILPRTAPIGTMRGYLNAAAKPPKKTASK